jgi:hypothetical protein
MNISHFFARQQPIPSFLADVYLGENCWEEK